MAAFGVDVDDGNATAIRQQIDSVDIAKGGSAAGAADRGLLSHATLDVLSGLHRLKLVLGSDHALVEEGRSAVLADHRLGNADNAGASRAHQLAGPPVVGLVAGPAVERPHDHVVNAGGDVLIAALEFVEHFQEAGALMQLDVGAAARVAELAHDLGLQLLGLVLSALALGGDRQTVIAVVGVDLTLGGDPQVGKGSLGELRDLLLLRLACGGDSHVYLLSCRRC